MANNQPDTSTSRIGRSSRGPIITFVIWLALLVAATVYFFMQPPEAGFFTEAQARTGVIEYGQHCASCHGADLQGISAPALVGEQFLENWQGRSVADLYTYTHTQMPLGRGSTLSDETYAATVVYMLEQNGFPSGDVALSPNDSRLRLLFIDREQAQEEPSAFSKQASGGTPQLVQFVQTEPQETQDQTPVAQDDTTPLTTGQQIYESQCASCHGADGGGGIGPSLQNNPRLEDAAWTIRRIALGGLGMPAYANQLSSTDIAEVTSYIRTEFENAYGEVGSDEVSEVVAMLEPNSLQPVTSDLASAPLGEQRYVQLCAACHGLQGGGGVGPPLAGNADLENTQLVIPTILYGRGIMPGFSLHSNLEIAEITSYIRTAWGNSYGSVNADVVQIYRPEGSQANVGGMNTLPPNTTSTDEENAGQTTTNQTPSDETAPAQTPTTTQGEEQ
jgi:mono/diheme cytochrome c family protein